MIRRLLRRLRGSRKPSAVGRQATLAAQITDVVAYLEAEGWHEDRGRLQRYAAWLIEARMAYEITDGRVISDGRSTAHN